MENPVVFQFRVFLCFKFAFIGAVIHKEPMQ